MSIHMCMLCTCKAFETIHAFVKRKKWQHCYDLWASTHEPENVPRKTISDSRYKSDFQFKLKEFDCVFLQIVAALAVSLGPLAAGLGKGYSSPAIASLQELQIRTRGGNYTSFTVTDQEASWVASLSLLGEFETTPINDLSLLFVQKI